MQKLVYAAALLCFLLLAFCPGKARADTISYTGNLRTDAAASTCIGCITDSDYAQYGAVLRSFTLSTASNVSAITYGYGGGTNGAGTIIAESGFESYLSLFDGSGNFLSSTYFGTTCPAGAKTNTALGGCYDVSLNAGMLAAGTYLLAISANENVSLAENYSAGNLSDGFTGLGNLYQGEDLHYAFDVNLAEVSTTPPAQTPEPASGVLVGSALAAFVLLKQHRSFRRNV